MLNMVTARYLEPEDLPGLREVLASGDPADLHPWLDPRGMATGWKLDEVTEYAQLALSCLSKR